MSITSDLQARLQICRTDAAAVATELTAEEACPLASVDPPTWCHRGTWARGRRLTNRPTNPSRPATEAASPAGRETGHLPAAAETKAARRQREAAAACLCCAAPGRLERPRAAPGPGQRPHPPAAAAPRTTRWSGRSRASRLRLSDSDPSAPRPPRRHRPSPAAAAAGKRAARGAEVRSLPQTKMCHRTALKPAALHQRIRQGRWWWRTCKAANSHSAHPGKRLPQAFRGARC
mmetsp:Transcript_56176/g.182312  ORF Transcript_56176/g.182312 Transcript_56176/m.182312 type:complete len:233 (+) Transcript_56176:139-837(+)